MWLISIHFIHRKLFFSVINLYLSPVERLILFRFWCGIESNGNKETYRSVSFVSLFMILWSLWRSYEIVIKFVRDKEEKKNRLKAAFTLAFTYCQRLSKSLFKLQAHTLRWPWNIWLFRFSFRCSRCEQKSKTIQLHLRHRQPFQSIHFAHNDVYVTQFDSYNYFLCAALQSTAYPISSVFTCKP